MEIYLYFENALRKRLGLLTAITHTHYASGIGAVPWINIDELARAVESTYMDTLVDIPSLQGIAKQDKATMRELGQVNIVADAALMALEDKKPADIFKEASFLPPEIKGLFSVMAELCQRPDSLSEADYLDAAKQLSKLREQARSLILKQWVRKTRR